MCYGSAVRSQYPRARVHKIDTSQAEALEGVVCVLTAKDIPGENYIGHIEKDQPTLIPEGEITHYLGDAIALVCARSREILEEAKKLVLENERKEFLENEWPAIARRIVLLDIDKSMLKF